MLPYVPISSVMLLCVYVKHFLFIYNLRILFISTKSTAKNLYLSDASLLLCDIFI